MNGTRTVMKIASLSTGGSPASTVIDIGQTLSRANRRLYRQGMRYTAKLDFEGKSQSLLALDEFDEDADGNPIMPRFKVFALNDNWSTQSAWKAALESHMNNSIEEEGRRARWNDFRVKHGWTAGGVAEGVPMSYTGFDLQPRPLTAGEFVLSESRNEQGDIFQYTWGDATPGNFSITGEFDKAGQVSVQPSHIVGEMPYSRLDDDEQDDQALHLETSGNEPPYNRINANPFEWNLVADISFSGDGTTQTTGYFDAPCGFIVVVGYYKDYIQFDPLHDTLMTLKVKPGKYKGVKATPLGVATKVNATEYKVK